MQIIQLACICEHGLTVLAIVMIQLNLNIRFYTVLTGKMCLIFYDNYNVSMQYVDNNSCL